jgi:hypothetical protein
MDYGSFLIMTFPPIPVYPEAIDSDYTLFLVYNTTETLTTTDNPAWSQEIDIVPVGSEEREIWADNGFANISGELLYYDSVEKDVNGKVNKLKKCARNLGGERTKHNNKCTWIRSYVVAEHHNQLVDAMLRTEDFIGYNFDPRQETLDWRIRNLEALEIIFDDHQCPDIVFTFNVIEDDAVTGVLAEYLIEVNPPGLVVDVRVDFGDGQYTNALEGQHRYAVNAKVDPVVSVTNDTCTVIQTPIERINPEEPPPVEETRVEIPIPEIPEFPEFTLVPCDVPEPSVQLPPLVVPCISIEGQIGPIPSVIEGPNINLVSTVTITGPDNPVQILHSTVEIIGEVNIPPIVEIVPEIPPTIIIDPPIPPTIVIIGPQSQVTLELDATELPRLEVDWGAPPEMEVALTLAQNVKTPERFAADPDLVNEFGEEFADLFEASETMKVEYETVGIPEEIKIIPPEMPDVKIVADDVPRSIKVDCTEANIPTDIKIHGPESPIPDSITFDGPEEIDLVYRGQGVKLDTTGATIKLEMEKEIPTTILVEIPEPIPEKIVVESTIPDKIVLEGPESIPLILPEDISVPLTMPENPEVEMVWRGSPIEVKITMDEIMDKQADGKNCVMITPCPIN